MIFTTIKTIAIDGPSGAGKSTLSRMLAKKYGLIYVDTGAMYRTIALYVMQCGVSSTDYESVKCLLPSIGISMSYDETGVQRMILNGTDVSDTIRLPEVSINASNVSAIPEVRQFLLKMQQDIAERNSVIMDGRDIGTVVLPNAGLKIFLSAAPEDRARRRYAELCEKNIKTSYDDVLSDMICRDKNDSTRKTAPLKPADGAVIVDTTGFTLEESFSRLSILVEQYLNK